MEATIGHNSAADEPATKFAKDQLRSIIERIERLNEEKRVIVDDIKDIFTEAKSQGYNVPAMRQIIKLRGEDPDKRAERETILETYMQALGLL
jgi:uncharacterized protein (UPF0335 family)